MSLPISYPCRGWLSNRDKIRSSALPFFQACSPFVPIYVPPTYATQAALSGFHGISIFFPPGCKAPGRTPCHATQGRYVRSACPLLDGRVVVKMLDMIGLERTA